MAIYRFRVFLEDDEDVYRDIDIKASQSFEDLHLVIQDAFKFDKKHAASFFVSDDYWRKGQEITLRKEDLPLDEEEVRLGVDPKKLMKEARIAHFIEQPHQRFIYVFDVEAQWTFGIEMLKIAEESSKTNYPSVVRTNGNAPKQYKQTLAPKQDVTLDSLLAALTASAEDEAVDTSIYSQISDEDGVEDEDINSLEGEEGEESEEGEEDAGEEGENEDYGFGEEGYEEEER